MGELVNGSVEPITTDILKSLEKKFIVFKSLGKHKKISGHPRVYSPNNELTNCNSLYLQV